MATPEVILRVPADSSQRAVDHVAVANFARFRGRKDDALPLADHVAPYLSALNRVFVSSHVDECISRMPRHRGYRDASPQPFVCITQRSRVGVVRGLAPQGGRRRPIVSHALPSVARSHRFMAIDARASEN
ncbi:protein of unknown function [Microbacterium sp. Nx66]|nr:protein of unknown function [Microbacterium sp. Nx66]